MTRSGIDIRMPVARKESFSSSPASDPDAAGLFERSMHRAKADERISENESELDEPQAAPERHSLAKTRQQLAPTGQAAEYSRNGKQSEGPEIVSGRSFLANPLVEHALASRHDELPGLLEERMPFSSVPGNVPGGGQVVSSGSDHPVGGGNTAYATNYQDFSRALQQTLRESSPGSAREWRFSFQDARLPLTQMNMTSLPSGGWTVALSSTGIDRDNLARRLDELELKLKRLNRGIEGVAIVKEGTRER